MSVCKGCQPIRFPGIKHKAKARHFCESPNCLCGSCHPRAQTTDEEYRTWMAKFGGFYIDNTKTLIRMAKQKKLKPDG